MADGKRRPARTRDRRRGTHKGRRRAAWTSAPSSTCDIRRSKRIANVGAVDELISTSPYHGHRLQGLVDRGTPVPPCLTLLPCQSGPARPLRRHWLQVHHQLAQAMGHHDGDQFRPGSATSIASIGRGSHGRRAPQTGWTTHLVSVHVPTSWTDTSGWLRARGVAPHLPQVCHFQAERCFPLGIVGA